MAIIGRLYEIEREIADADKKTGALLAVDETGAAAKTHHGAPASPAWGRINGKEMIVLACGPGMCYGIDPNLTPGADGKPGVLKTIWQFDCMKRTKTRKWWPTGNSMFRHMAAVCRCASPAVANGVPYSSDQKYLYAVQAKPDIN